MKVCAEGAPSYLGLGLPDSSMHELMKRARMMSCHFASCGVLMRGMISGGLLKWLIQICSASACAVMFHACPPHQPMAAAAGNPTKAACVHFACVLWLSHSHRFLSLHRLIFAHGSLGGSLFWMMARVSSRVRAHSFLEAPLGPAWGESTVASSWTHAHSRAYFLANVCAQRRRGCRTQPGSSRTWLPTLSHKCSTACLHTAAMAIISEGFGWSSYV